ncbi:MAG: S41 family peptidase [Candidatus Nomurabacteria bacterium]|nr:S41 family peptidase [Candidatus Nomurabacteria bacterium]
MISIKTFFTVTGIKKRVVLKYITTLFILIILGVFGYSAYTKQHISNSINKEKALIYKTPEEKDIYVRFIMESYDSINKNYWAKLSEDNLANLFQLSIQKVKNQTDLPEMATTSRSGVSKMVAKAITTATSSLAKKQIAVDTIILATTNLEPYGRNGLFSKKQETDLRQNVSNINPDTNLYKNLGVETGSPASVVEKAYKEKAAILAKATSTEAKDELKKITYANKVLTNEYNKKLYDENKIEPTVFSKILGNTLYLAISKISPTTLSEIGVILDKASTTPRLDSMIIDLRGNIGGALDFLQYFLGAFVGQNQFAFDLFHQGEYDAQRTTIEKFEPLNRYKDRAILTDNMTQSTAELTAATFKRLNMAKVIGSTTRGWGTVENTFPLESVIDENESYSLFLVRSITLRDDNVPIEGRGVAPDIDVKSSSFKEDLQKAFRNSSLIRAVEEQMKSGPVR